MEANVRNVNMIITIVLLCLLTLPANGRIHRLKLEDDGRKEITLSTFGFLKDGTLAVNISSFTVKRKSKPAANSTVTLFGFTLDKSKSPGLSSYMEGMQSKCILNNPGISEENMESIFFRFDLNTNKMNIQRVGNDMKSLMVSTEPRNYFLIAHDLNHVSRRSVRTEDLNAKLSDDYLLGNRRKLRAAEPKVKEGGVSGQEGGAKDEATPSDTKATPSDSKTPPSDSKTPPSDNKTPPSDSKTPPSDSKTTPSDSKATPSDNKATPSDSKATPPASIPTSSSLPQGQTGTSTSAKPQEAGSVNPVSGGNKTDGTQGAVAGQAVAPDGDLVDSLVVNVDEDGMYPEYQTYFLVYIQKPEEEGLYNLFFHNCLSYSENQDEYTLIDLTMEIIEDNNGNFLTAGEMPVPSLYFTFSVLFFIAGVAWLSVVRKSKEEVYKVHYLMLVVVFVKSLACLFHGVNMYFIQISGHHEDAWAILWYIVYLTRGALMFVTVLLIGAGWAFIKHVLTDREKKLFLVVISLQILDRVAEVIVEESEEGNQSYMTWKEIFILVDLLCCGAILFPVVWSIRHLQEASGTDGKAAINLQKLKLFRHFYILVVCYIYFTRIIVYLMKITLPFKLEWLTDLFTELAMMVFFVVTGAKFRPASDNPYLQVPLDSDDEDIEMDEVLTKTGSTETVVRVNQKTEGATNQIKQRESSHEYD